MIKRFMFYFVSFAEFGPFARPGCAARAGVLFVIKSYSSITGHNLFRRVHRDPHDRMLRVDSQVRREDG